jgi:hypothetical protein
MTDDNQNDVSAVGHLKANRPIWHRPQVHRIDLVRRTMGGSPGSTSDCVGFSLSRQETPQECFPS